MGILAFILFMLATPAAAQFAGGFADGMARSQELTIQERAIELDARDGGNRYDRLRQQQQLDRIERQLRQNQEFIENTAKPRDRLLYGR